MIYNYPSCRLDDPKAVRVLLSKFLKSKYWGLFSFQPNTMTCIDQNDFKVLKKYEPFGLVIFKVEDLLALPDYIQDTYYDIYKVLLDPLQGHLKDVVAKYYYIDMEKFMKLMDIKI